MQSWYFFHLYTLDEFRVFKFEEKDFFKRQNNKEKRKTSLTFTLISLKIKRKREFMTLIDHSKTDISQRGDSSYAETYRTAYSHGLEAIYALETVDIKSVRRIEMPSLVVPKKKSEVSRKKTSVSSSSQLEFDFGPSFRNSISSFLVREPIQVLGLSSSAERCLLLQGLKLLNDLVKESTSLNGIGQGHIQEIKEKLELYIDGRPTRQCESVDFSAWVRSLAIELDRKKFFIEMQHYNMCELFSLAPLENVEVNRLTLERKQEWIQQLEVQLKTPSRKMAINQDIENITSAFVKPWMRNRLGLATKNELMERLQRISDDPIIAKKALNFFSAIYYENQFPLKNSLFQVDEDLYCVDQAAATSYRQAVEKALTYFYKPTIQYPLMNLVRMLEKEFSRCWYNFSEGFFEKILRYAPQFRVRKNSDNVLIVRLT